MRPPESGLSGSRSDIQEAHVGRVLLDEISPRLDLVAHQAREPEIGGRGILDVDANENAASGVHGRFPELAVVHLAETLEAADLYTLLCEVDRFVAELFERLRFGALLAKTERERRQPACNLGQPAVGAT